MKNAQEIVFDLWRSHKNYLGNRSVNHQLDITDYLAGIFCPGPFYYYVIDSPTLSFDIVSRGTEDLLGLKPEEVTLEKLIDLIHPGDLSFFLRCEDIVAYFLKNCISPEKVVKYKICYCLRERQKDGSYRLFLLQTVTMKTTDEGALLKVFGSHTDISHITKVNNQRLSLIGLDGEPSYMDIDVFTDNAIENYKPYIPLKDNSPFTNRELEILQLIGLGLSTSQIADELFISKETVNTHRKNILRKSNAKNTIELIVESVRNGYLPPN